MLFPGGVIETDGVGWLQADGSVYTGKEWPLPNVNSHPRSAGCYSRFLRK